MGAPCLVPYLDLCNSSIWLFLSISFYNKIVIKYVFL